jgi:hypothetical protein
VRTATLETNFGTNGNAVMVRSDFRGIDELRRGAGWRGPRRKIGPELSGAGAALSVRHASDVDVLACPRCAGTLRLIAIVEDPPRFARSCSLVPAVAVHRVRAEHQSHGDGHNLSSAPAPSVPRSIRSHRGESLLPVHRCPMAPRPPNLA